MSLKYSWIYFTTEIVDDMRRKYTLSPHVSTICTAKRPHVYDMRRKTSTRERFAVRTFCGVTMLNLLTIFLFFLNLFLFINPLPDIHAF
jgi:hypothetical protein